MEHASSHCSPFRCTSKSLLYLSPLGPMIHGRPMRHPCPAPPFARRFFAFARFEPCSFVWNKPFSFFFFFNQWTGITGSTGKADGRPRRALWFWKHEIVSPPDRNRRPSCPFPCSDHFPNSVVFFLSIPCSYNLPLLQMRGRRGVGLPFHDRFFFRRVILPVATNHFLFPTPLVTALLNLFSLSKCSIAVYLEPHRDFRDFLERFLASPQ